MDCAPTGTQAPAPPEPLQALPPPLPAAPTMGVVPVVGGEAAAATATERVAEKNAASGVLTVPPSKRLSLAFNNITFSVPVKGKKKDGEGKASTRAILSNITGFIRPGEVVAIMGPSGAGKSTMLDALAGRLGKGLEGEVYVGGKPRDATFKHYASYVQQEDSLFGTLTVRQTLHFAARLNVPPDADGRPASAEKQSKAVETVSAAMGLTSCMDTKIGDVFYKGISGGQKRRVSIAVELLKEPRILLLDEPTSGLDSTSAYRVMKSVRALARSGRAIAATIHQPSSDVFRLMDRLLLLSGGRVVYFGPTSQVVDWFVKQNRPCPPLTNPADFAIDQVNTDFEGFDDSADDEEDGEMGRELAEMESGKAPLIAGKGTAEGVNMLIEAWASSQEGMAVEEEAKALIVATPSGPGDVNKDVESGMGMELSSTSEGRQPRTGLKAKILGQRYNTRFHVQVIEVVKRSLRDAVLNPGVVWARLVMYTALAVMLAWMYWREGVDPGQKAVLNISSVLFFIAAFFIFMSVAALPAFILEAAVFKRESSNAWYSPAAYVVGTSVASLPGTFLIALFASAIVFPSVQLAGSFGVFLLILFVSLVTAEAFMTFIAVATGSLLLLGMALAAGIFAMFMLTEGFFIIRSSLPAFWKGISYISMHRYCFEAFMYNQWNNVDTIACDEAACQFYTGQSVLEYYGMENTKIWEDAIILIAMAVIYRILQWAVLSKFYSGKN